MKINITLAWKKNQLAALKELYNLRENLRPLITLLNAPYIRDVNKEIVNIQGNITDLYNDLTPIAKYIEFEM